MAIRRREEQSPLALRGCSVGDVPFVAAGKLHGWGFVQFESVEAAERACQMTDVTLMGRDLFIDAASRNSSSAVTGQPVQGCWFCLSSEDADLSLVVSVGKSLPSNLKILFRSSPVLMALALTELPADQSGSTCQAVKISWRNSWPLDAGCLERHRAQAS